MSAKVSRADLFQPVKLMSKCVSCGADIVFTAPKFLADSEKVRPRQCRSCLEALDEARQEKTEEVLKRERERRRAKYAFGFIDPAWGFPAVMATIAVSSFDGYPKVVEWTKRAAAGGLCRPLGFFGKTGRGKTVLACLAGMKFASLRYENGAEKVGIIFATAADIVRGFRSAIAERVSEEDILRRYAECDLLVLDDFATEHDTEYSSAVLYGVVERRDRDGKPVIWTTNLTPEDFRGRYGERMVSRLWSGVVVEVKGEDRRFGRAEG